jgi:beta-lactamase superfamily II metal-dependent hydrolase
MKVMIFDVEHGASAFLRTPTNHAVLIDCGCTESFSPALYLAEHELPTATKFDNRALTELIITHPHDDHICDIATVHHVCEPRLLTRGTYNWQDVKVAEDCSYENLDTYTDWQAAYTETPVSLPNYGMTIDSFSLSPEEAKKVDESKYLNNSSIITVATVPGNLHTVKFLFGGDMETAGWEALLRLRPKFKEVVKGVHFYIVSHHGHKSGFSEALYAAMGTPMVNIVSIHNGDENIDDRYSQEIYAKGATMGGETRRRITTRCDGTITIDLNEKGQYSIVGHALAPNKPKPSVAKYNVLGRGF